MSRWRGAAGVVTGSVVPDDAVEATACLAELDAFGSGIEERMETVRRADSVMLRRHVDLNCESELTDEGGYERAP